jgi:hypothetical protein
MLRNGEHRVPVAIRLVLANLFHRRPPTSDFIAYRLCIHFVSLVQLQRCRISPGAIDLQLEVRSRLLSGRTSKRTGLRLAELANRLHTAAQIGEHGDRTALTSPITSGFPKPFSGTFLKETGSLLLRNCSRCRLTFYQPAGCLFSGLNVSRYSCWRNHQRAGFFSKRSQKSPFETGD